MEITHPPRVRELTQHTTDVVVLLLNWFNHYRYIFLLFYLIIVFESRTSNYEYGWIATYYYLHLSKLINNSM